MFNFNGTLTASQADSIAFNRGFLYGDSVFETLKVLDGKVLFLEDHYFRLMSAMRIIRMEIPMSFTMEFMESQLLDTANASGCADSARLRMTVFRNAGGNYLPLSREVSYVITSTSIEQKVYAIEPGRYEVDLYKDFYVTRQLLSTIKSTNRIINVTGSIYAAENDLQNCLLMNEQKNIVEALNGNLFMVFGNKVITPPLSEGCLNGVMRKQIIEIIKREENIEFSEETVSPFDLQKADEIFITNVIIGIQPITRYRKKEYSADFSKRILGKLNAKIRLY